MNASIIFWILITFISLEFLIEKFLAYLNAKHFNDEIPGNLKDIFDENEYKKSQEYKKVNYQFSNLTSIIYFLIILVLLFSGGLGLLDQWVRNLTESKFLQTLMFFGILISVSHLISLPFDYYKTFVIEEKFGFNRSTKKLFFLDSFKSFLLNLIILGILGSIILLIYQQTQQNFWWIALIVISLFMVLLNMFYGEIFIPLFNKLTPLSEGPLYDGLKELANKTRYNLDKIFIIDGSKRTEKANAFFMGLGPKKKVVLYDTLIKGLTPNEITAVLAHEIGHYKKKHILFNLIFSILSMAILLFLFSRVIENPLLAKALGAKQTSFHIGLIAFALLFTPVSFLMGIFTNYLSRKFEFQADNFAKQHSNAEDLISGLKKLSKKSLSNLTPHPWYVFVYYSHPDLQKRIDNLLKENV